MNKDKINNCEIKELENKIELLDQKMNACFKKVNDNYYTLLVLGKETNERIDKNIDQNNNEQIEEEIKKIKKYINDKISFIDYRINKIKKNN